MSEFSFSNEGPAASPATVTSGGAIDASEAHVSILLARELVPGYAPERPEDGAPYAEVVIDTLQLADPRPYTYKVPSAWRGKLLPGQAVLVPFGPKRGVAGYVTGLSFEAPDDHEMRELEDVVAGDVMPLALQALFLWLADYYMAPLSAVLTTAMPRGTLSRMKRSVNLAVSMETFAEMATRWSGPMATLAQIMIEGDGTAALARLQTAAKRSGAVLTEWRRLGLIRYHNALLPPERREKLQLHATLTSGAYEPLTARQTEIVDILARHGGTMLVADLARAASTTADTLRRLEGKGALSLHQSPVRRSAIGVANGEVPPPLTPHQAEVLATIEAEKGAGATFLLHGVTGSGKTEVYLQAIAHALDKDQGAIVLVPEIALTPQTVRRFQARFGDEVAVLHSHLGTGERYDEWQRIRDGAARVVVGARSAVFAPVPRLGLIIIDEEHETSYKQDKTPRYHARRVAEERCRLEGATLILGSATPCLESFKAAEDGRYKLLSMPDRVNNRPMPPVTVVDMRRELQEGNRRLFSRALKTHLEGALERGEQAILLLNRRGYSSFVFCRGCGFVCKCARCAVAMTFHQMPRSDSGILRCHYCDAFSEVPETCPSCKSPYIKHFGAGTQQIEEAARQAFPDARIVRVDRDTTSRKGSHQVMLDAFGRGEYDLLIGTQMVAKGLDFPRVTVVGVMAADGALHLPDYRASEITFQLLTQVAGRAGRGDLASQVVIQTYSPTHQAIQAAMTHDFQGFYDFEIQERKETGYPPFMHLVNVVFSSPESRLARKAGSELAEALRAYPDLEVYGPMEAPLAMLRGLHRQMVLLKTADLQLARAALRHALPPCQQPGVRVSVDLEPSSLL